MFSTTVWPLLGFSAAFALAQSNNLVQQSQDKSANDWKNPALPNLSATVTEGENYTIEWTSGLAPYFSNWGDKVDLTNVTLWVSSGSFNYTKIIGQDINVEKTSQFVWNASLPEEQYSSPQNWTFRFAPADMTQLKNLGNGTIRSPAFNFAAANASSTAAASTSASSTASPTSSSSSSSSTSSTSSSAGLTNDSHSSSGISGGAIAGIVIGVIAALTLCGALFFFLRRRRNAVHPPLPIVEKSLTNNSSSGGAPSDTLPPSPPNGPKYPASSRYSMSRYSNSVRRPGQQHSIYAFPNSESMRYRVDSADELFDGLR